MHFTANQLAQAIDGITARIYVTECGCGEIALYSVDIQTVELQCTYGGDRYGNAECFDLAFYTDSELLDAVNEWTADCIKCLHLDLADNA